MNDDDDDDDDDDKQNFTSPKKINDKYWLIKEVMNGPWDHKVWFSRVG